MTGGRSGIGAAIAQRLKAEGARVITAQRGVDTQCEYITADFLNTATPKHLINEVIKRAGSLDILINNAGVMREGTVAQCIQSHTDHQSAAYAHKGS